MSDRPELEWPELTLLTKYRLAVAPPQHEHGRRDVHDDRELPDGDVLLQDVHDFTGRFVAYPSEESQVAHPLWKRTPT